MNTRYNGSNYNAFKDLNGSLSRDKKSFVAPKPKIQNLMQSHIYLHAISDVNKVYLTYVDRSAAGPDKMIQFDITNHEEGGRNYAKVSVKRPWRNEPIEYVNKNFSIESILAGYAFLHEHVTSSVLPEPTYRVKLKPEEIESDFLNGDLSKTKYELWQKNNDKYSVSDWQCSYCSYLNQCKSDQGIL